MWIRDFLGCLRIYVFTAVTMNNVVFWDVAPYGSPYNRRFIGICRLPLQGRKICEVGITLVITSTL
jgi:hypothetical protein